MQAGHYCIWPAFSACSPAWRCCSTHNVWALDWRVLITLIGWTSLIRALVTIFRPQWIVSTGAKLIALKGVFVATGAVDLIIGAILSYFGYLA